MTGDGSRPGRQAMSRTAPCFRRGLHERDAQRTMCAVPDLEWAVLPVQRCAEASAALGTAEVPQDICEAPARRTGCCPVR